MACFGERAGCRRNAFALGERPLERGQTLAREPRLLPQLQAAQLSRRRARRKPRPRRGVTQRLDERRRALAPQLQPLARALEPVERGRRRLALAGGVRQFLLRAVPLGEQRLELGLRSPLRMVGRRPPLRRLADPLVDADQVESCECRLERGDLSSELLRPLRCARLERERSEPLLHLCLDVPRPRDVLPDPRELQLRAVAAPLELPETCRLLHERSPLLGLRGEDLLDLALRDDRARCAAEADVRQQLHEVGAPNGGPVDQVLPLAAPVQATHDGDFRGQGGQRVVRVVEHELHLAVGRRLAGSRTREQHVVGLFGAELIGAEAPRRPEQRVCDIGLPGPVRPDDHGDAGLEANLDRFREGLEAADADGAEMHAAGTLVTRADSATGRRGPSRVPVWPLPAPRPSSRSRRRRRPGRRRSPRPT